MAQHQETGSISKRLTWIGHAWSKLARRRTRVGIDMEWRYQWIREHAPGKSFADIGGLFKHVGDISFLAEEVGATEVTLFDVGDPDKEVGGKPEWGKFDDKRAERNSKVRFVQGDLEEPMTPDRIGIHDIVYYSGVLYHTPNPFLQLTQLRAITREKAFISTLTIPEVPGFPNACVFYPFLSEKAREPYAAGYGFREGLVAVGSPFDERPLHGYANCWWGITPSALRAMLLAARFEVEVERRLANGFIIEIVARPLPLEPSLPPTSYFRERGDARERGESIGTLEEWYEENKRERA